MTIYEIKEATKEKSPYFFSRDTLKFFGQTIRNFKVKTSPKGRIYIYAPSYDGTKLMGYTFREFKDNDLKPIYSNELTSYHRLVSTIEKYIQVH